MGPPDLFSHIQHVREEGNGENHSTDLARIPYDSAFCIFKGIRVKQENDSGVWERLPDACDLLSELSECVFSQTHPSNKVKSERT